MGTSPSPAAPDSAHCLQMPPWGRQGTVERRWSTMVAACQTRSCMWEDQEALSDSVQQQNCLLRHSVGDGGTQVKTKLRACQVCVV